MLAGLAREAHQHTAAKLDAANAKLFGKESELQEARRHHIEVRRAFMNAAPSPGHQVVAAFTACGLNFGSVAALDRLWAEFYTHYTDQLPETLSMTSLSRADEDGTFMAPACFQERKNEDRRRSPRAFR